MNNFNIKTEKFEGPIDLLLSFIEKRKVLVNDISLASITEDYIEYINNSNNFSLKNSANFVFVASTLMLIKSKSLLPELSLTEKEESDIEELQDRIRLFKIFKDRFEDIRRIFSKKIVFFAEDGSLDSQVVFTPSKDLTKDNITLSILDVIKRFPKKEKVEKKSVKKAINLEEVIERLSFRIRKNIKVSFREFSGLGKTDKLNVAITFLALLELVRSGNVLVNQENNFSDIDIENNQVNTPIYG